MANWSEEAMLSFIEEYKNEECIWNVKDSNHKNRQKCNEAWLRLSIVLDKSVKELKMRKESLMTTYRRHVKKKRESILLGTGPEGVYRPAWFAFEAMDSFLGTIYPSSNSFDYINTEEESSIHEIEQLDMSELEQDDDEEEEDYYLLQPTTSNKTSTRRRNDSERLPSPSELTVKVAKRTKESPSTKEEDDCDLFAKLLAKKLRDVPPDERTLLMYDIDTIFVDRIKRNMANDRNSE